MIAVITSASIILLVTVASIRCDEDSLGHFTRQYPWCHNDHVHMDMKKEAELYLNQTGAYTVGIGRAELGRIVSDGLLRLGCENMVASQNCCQSLTGDNIYTVLGLEDNALLGDIDYERSNVILLAWLLQLPAKCNDTTDWTTVTYEDILEEILHFNDDHDHEHDEHTADDDEGEGHEESHHHISPEQLERMMREINQTYEAGDWLDGYHSDYNRSNVCSLPDARMLRSRTIWRDVDKHHSDHIDEDEVGQMAALINLYLLHGYCLEKDRVLEDKLPQMDSFITALFNKYGESCIIDEHGFDELLEDLEIGDDHDDHSGHDEHGETTTSSDDDHDHDHDHDTPYGPDVTTTCLDSHTIQDTFYKDLHDDVITHDDFLSLCPALVQQRAQGCQHVDTNTDRLSPTNAQKYGFGTLAMLIIGLFALLGLVMARWRHTRGYNLMIVTMLGLAVGSLAGDAFLHLIPSGLGLHSHDDHAHDHDISNIEVEPYVWKMLGVCGSVWFFFLLQIGLSKFHTHSHQHNKIDVDLVVYNEKQSEGHHNAAYSGDGEDFPKDKQQNGVAHKEPQVEAEKGAAKTLNEVALMVMVGDGIHNLADGLAIGAAFSVDLALGLSTSIAVLCHEIPHEFGDVAIALSAGWSIKKVAIAQLISASFGFVGLYIGIPVADNADAQQWILVVTSGIFLYIALTDVIPELLVHYRESQGWATLILMNLGILLGFALMLLLSVFEEHIRI